MTTISKRGFKFLNHKFFIKANLALVMFGLLTACSTMRVNVSNKMLIPAYTRIGVAAFANHSDTPLANRQVETMVVGLLRARGFCNIKQFQHVQSCAKLLYCPDETLSKRAILSWARANRLTYVVTGAANEWRYKVGLDGEPVAGAALTMINVHTGQIVWTGVGSIIGGSRSGLDVVGQSMLQWMIFNNLCPISGPIGVPVKSTILVPVKAQVNAARYTK
ncbi:MAG: hypothetical protein H0U73_06385 [Tatlockia sp.]|nr:hypothetical protein [Tatlockia sp.]